jgi:hypothetical protein
MLGQIIYRRFDPKVIDIQPETLLFIRALFAFISTLLIVNKNIWVCMYSGIPEGNTGNIALRCLQSSIINSL